MGGIADIQDNKIVVHGKGDKYRETYLTAKAQIAIQEYLKQREDDNPWLFPKGARITELRKLGIPQKEMHLWWQHAENVRPGRRGSGSLESTVRDIGKRAGVENCHPHRFRRTGATMALRAGMPIIEVSKLLGHESIATTQIYLDIEEKQLQATHEKYVI